MTHLQRIAPVILVEDVISTAEYYRDALGFEFDRFWGDPPQMVLADRGDVRIGLMQAPVAHIPPAPSGFADAFIYVDDVDGLADEVRGRGARIVAEPAESTVFDGRTMSIIDCNRRVLTFVMIRSS